MHACILFLALNSLSLAFSCHIGAVWLRITGGSALLEAQPNLYRDALRQRFGQTTPSQLGAVEAPGFGVVFDIRRLGLSDDALLGYARVLCCLAQGHSDSLYCPWLPMLVATSMLVMSETHAFATATAVLHNVPDLIRQRQETWLMVCTFDELAESILAAPRQALFAHVGLEDSKSAPLTAHPMRGVVVDWVANCLPLPSLLHFVDNWIIKGRKVIYRYGLALLARWHTALQEQGASGSGESPMLPRDCARAAVDAAALATEAFSFSFTSKDIERSRQAAHERAWTSLTVTGFFLGVDEAWADAASAYRDGSQRDSTSLRLSTLVEEGSETRSRHAGSFGSGQTSASVLRLTSGGVDEIDAGAADDADDSRLLSAVAPSWSWSDAVDARPGSFTSAGQSVFDSFALEHRMPPVGEEGWSRPISGLVDRDDPTGMLLSARLSAAGSGSSLTLPQPSTQASALAAGQSAQLAPSDPARAGGERRGTVSVSSALGSEARDKAAAANAGRIETPMAPVAVPRVRAAMRGMLLATYGDFLKHNSGALEGETLELFECPRHRVMLQEQLGHGAFGTVCRGLLVPDGMTAEQAVVSMTCDLPAARFGPTAVLHQLAQPVKVAVKTVVPGAGPEEQAKFLLEGRMMMGLQHPNLLRLLGTCTTSLPFMLIVEYMPKGDLKAYLRKCRAPSGPEPVEGEAVVAVGIQVHNRERRLARSGHRPHIQGWEDLRRTLGRTAAAGVILTLDTTANGSTLFTSC